MPACRCTVPGVAWLGGQVKIPTPTATVQERAGSEQRRGYSKVSNLAWTFVSLLTCSVSADHTPAVHGAYVYIRAVPSC